MSDTEAATSEETAEETLWRIQVDSRARRVEAEKQAMFDRVAIVDRALARLSLTEARERLAEYVRHVEASPIYASDLAVEHAYKAVQEHVTYCEEMLTDLTKALYPPPE